MLIFHRRGGHRHPPRADSWPWVEGFVLDRHVIKSVPIGYLGQHMQFDTTRSAWGELVYQFKNKNGPPDDIIDTATAFVAERWASKIDGVVAAPPSLARAKQPAAILAEGVGAHIGGETMRRVANVLMEMGASEVRALAMTRTK